MSSVVWTSLARYLVRQEDLELLKGVDQESVSDLEFGEESLLDTRDVRENEVSDLDWWAGCCGLIIGTDQGIYQEHWSAKRPHPSHRA